MMRELESIKLKCSGPSKVRKAKDENTLPPRPHPHPYPYLHPHPPAPSPRAISHDLQTSGVPSVMCAFPLYLGCDGASENSSDREANQSSNGIYSTDPHTGSPDPDPDEDTRQREREREGEGEPVLFDSLCGSLTFTVRFAQGVSKIFLGDSVVPKFAAKVGSEPTLFPM